MAFRSAPLGAKFNSQPIAAALRRTLALPARFIISSLVSRQIHFTVYWLSCERGSGREAEALFSGRLRHLDGSERCMLRGALYSAASVFKSAKGSLWDARAEWPVNSCAFFFYSIDMCCTFLATKRLLFYVYFQLATFLQGPQCQPDLRKLTHLATIWFFLHRFLVLKMTTEFLSEMLVASCKNADWKRH